MLIFFKLALLIMSLIKNIKEHWLIILIISVALAYRFIPIGQYQFSHDELSGLSRTVFTDLFSEINFGVKVLDTHPALIQLYLWIWVKLFGYNEIAIKLPFLLCGVLSVWYIYKLGKNYLSEAAGLISATILASSFIFIVYSSYARMYIPGVLFSILLLNSIFKIVFASPDKKDYLLMTLWLVLSAYNHHISCLFASTVFGLSLFYIDKTRLKTFILFGAVAVIIYLPHLPITLYQFSIGGIGFEQGGWLSKPRTFELYYFVKTLLGCGISGKLMMLIFVGLITLSVFKLKPISKKQFFLFWLFIVNYAIIHLYSVFRSPVLQFSVLLFSAIAFVLFISSFAQMLSKKQVALFSMLIILLCSFQNIRKKHFFSKVNIHAYEEQAKTITKMHRIAGANNVTAILGSEPFFVYAYEKKYQTKFNYISVYDSLFVNNQKFTSYLKSLQQPYIVLCGIGAADVQHIKQYFPYIVSNKEDYFSNVTVLSKYNFGYYDVSVLYDTGLLNSDVNVYLESNKPITFQKDTFYYRVNLKDKEYPFNLSIPLNRALVQNNQSLVAEVSFIARKDSISDKDLICISVGNEKKSSVFYKSAKLIDYYNSDKSVQKALVDVFAGTEFKSWLKDNMNVNIFLKKGKKSAYTVCNFKLKVTDYNPTKWALWD